MKHSKSFHLKRFASRRLGCAPALMIVAAASVFIAACGDNALSWNPTNSLEFQQRACFEFMKGKNTEAIADYSRAIKLAETSPGVVLSDLYAARGLCYSHNKQYNEGLSDETKAIALVKGGNAKGTAVTVSDEPGERKLSAEDSLKSLLADYYDKRADDDESLKDSEKALDDYNAAVASGAADSFGAAYLQHRALFLTLSFSIRNPLTIAPPQ